MREETTTPVAIPAIAEFAIVMFIFSDAVLARAMSPAVVIKFEFVI